MSDEFDDQSIFFNRRTDKTIVSKRITDRLTGQKLRIFSKIVDGSEGLRFAKVANECVLRTSADRFEIKATVVEDDRRIRTLTIQKFNRVSGPHEKLHFSFVGQEIGTLLNFAAGIDALDFSGEEKVHVSDAQLEQLVVSKEQAKRIFAQHEHLFVEIAERADLQQDLVALGYRRAQLERFEQLLKDASFFKRQIEELGATPEGVWQRFFESNTWIFGYGLTYQFLTGLDQRRLEQIVSGHGLDRLGKRADALLKTRGIINSLCFVEIKRHDTSLLESRAHRPGVWAPSRELASAAAQVQVTVQDAVEAYSRKLVPIFDDGAPTGETLFNISPRSFLVVGSLSEFIESDGINEPKFRSFELYRRSTTRPEIITFDELLERARFIVEQPR